MDIVAYVYNLAQEGGRDRGRGREIERGIKGKGTERENKNIIKSDYWQSLKILGN